jgi:hypothetical protein
VQVRGGFRVLGGGLRSRKSFRGRTRVGFRPACRARQPGGEQCVRDVHLPPLAGLASRRARQLALYFLATPGGRIRRSSWLCVLAVAMPVPTFVAPGSIRVTRKQRSQSEEPARRLLRAAVCACRHRNQASPGLMHGYGPYCQTPALHLCRTVIRSKARSIEQLYDRTVVRQRRLA